MYQRAPGRPAGGSRLDVAAHLARARHPFQRRRDRPAGARGRRRRPLRRLRTWCSASGICPTYELEAAGAPVGLGVDGSASNDSSNMMEAVRHALMIGRLALRRLARSRISTRCAGRRKARRAAWGATTSAASPPGMQADLALFKLDEPRFSGAHDPLAALVLCGAHRADRVMIAGAGGSSTARRTASTSTRSWPNTRPRRWRSREPLPLRRRGWARGRGLRRRHCLPPVARPSEMAVKLFLARLIGHRQRIPGRSRPHLIASDVHVDVLGQTSRCPSPHRAKAAQSFPATSSASR